MEVPNNANHPQQDPDNNDVDNQSTFFLQNVDQNLAKTMETDSNLNFNNKENKKESAIFNKTASVGDSIPTQDHSAANNCLTAKETNENVTTGDESTPTNSCISDAENIINALMKSASTGVREVLLDSNANNTTVSNLEINNLSPNAEINQTLAITADKQSAQFLPGKIETQMAGGETEANKNESVESKISAPNPQLNDNTAETTEDPATLLDTENVLSDDLSSINTVGPQVVSEFSNILFGEQETKILNNPTALNTETLITENNESDVPKNLNTLQLNVVEPCNTIDVTAQQESAIINSTDGNKTFLEHLHTVESNVTIESVDNLNPTIKPDSIVENLPNNQTIDDTVEGSSKTLSSTFEPIVNLEVTRETFVSEAADIVVSNESSFQDLLSTVEQIVELYHDPETNDTVMNNGGAAQNSIFLEPNVQVKCDLVAPKTSDDDVISDALEMIIETVASESSTVLPLSKESSANEDPTTASNSTALKTEINTQEEDAITFVQNKKIIAEVPNSSEEEELVKCDLAGPELSDDDVISDALKMIIETVASESSTVLLLSNESSANEDPTKASNSTALKTEINVQEEDTIIFVQNKKIIPEVPNNSEEEEFVKCDLAGSELSNKDVISDALEMIIETVASESSNVLSLSKESSANEDPTKASNSTALKTEINMQVPNSSEEEEFPACASNTLNIEKNQDLGKDVVEDKLDLILIPTEVGHKLGLFVSAPIVPKHNNEEYDEKISISAETINPETEDDQEVRKEDDFQFSAKKIDVEANEENVKDESKTDDSENTVVAAELKGDQAEVKDLRNEGRSVQFLVKSLDKETANLEENLKSETTGETTSSQGEDLNTENSFVEHTVTSTKTVNTSDTTQPQDFHNMAFVCEKDDKNWVVSNLNHQIESSHRHNTGFRQDESPEKEESKVHKLFKALNFFGLRQKISNTPENLPENGKAATNKPQDAESEISGAENGAISNNASECTTGVKDSERRVTDQSTAEEYGTAFNVTDVDPATVIENTQKDTTDEGSSRKTSSKVTDLQPSTIVKPEEIGAVIANKPNTNSTALKSLDSREDVNLTSGITSAEAQPDEKQLSRETDLQQTVLKLQAKLQQKDTVIANQELELKRFGEVLSKYDKAMPVFAAKHEKLQNSYKSVCAQVSTLETALHDGIEKYERTKKVIEAYRANEINYKEKIKILDAKCMDQQEKYVEMTKQAMEQLQRMNAEYAILKKNKEVSVMKQNAATRLLEIKIASLESTLIQKNKELEQLSTLYDQVMETM